MKMPKVLDTIWITGWGIPGCIGIVIAENEAGERKAYVGNGWGFNEEMDTQLVVEKGGKLTLEMARHIVQLLEGTAPSETTTLDEEKAYAWLNESTGMISAYPGGGYDVPLFRRRPAIKQQNGGSA
jgi:hypothetical protein